MPRDSAYLFNSLYYTVISTARLISGMNWTIATCSKCGLMSAQERIILHGSTITVKCLSPSSIMVRQVSWWLPSNYSVVAFKCAEMARYFTHSVNRQCLLNHRFTGDNLSRGHFDVYERIHSQSSHRLTEAECHLDTGTPHTKVVERKEMWQMSWSPWTETNWLNTRRQIHKLTELQRCL